ncbi:MAG: DUF4340 domain-containing protein [Myxococcota bacterium]|jgi:hypothetical protein|nr:DUF4340 domain-containing protein [Myxococcota bacterium]
MQKSTIISILALVVLGLVVFSQEGQRQEKGIIRLSLKSLAMDTADKINVGGEKPIVLEKKNGVWVVDATIKANQKAATALLDALAKIESTSFVTAKKERYADFELAEKGTLVEVAAAGKPLVFLTLGKSEAGKTYVLGTQGIFALKGFTKVTFEKARSAWLDLAIVQEDINAAQKLDVALAGQPAFSLVKADKDWTLAEGTMTPEGYRFDANAAKQMVSALARLRAKDILAKAPTPNVSGLGDEASSLTLALKNEAGEAKEISVALGVPDAAGDVYGQMKGSTQVFVLAKSSAQRLRKSIDDLRDLKLLEAQSDQLTRLELRDGKTKNVFAKVDNTWVVEKSSEKTGDDFEFDPAGVERRVGAILRLKADAFDPEMTMAKAGLLKPNKSIVLGYTDGTKIQLGFGKDVDATSKQSFYASGNIDKYVYRISQNSANRLLGGLSTFKKTAPPPSMGGGLANIDPAQLANLPPDVRSSILEQIQAEKKKQEMMQRIQAQMAKQETTN